MFERRTGEGKDSEANWRPEVQGKFGLPSVGSISGIGDPKSHSACVAAIDEAPDEAG